MIFRSKTAKTAAIKKEKGRLILTPPPDPEKTYRSFLHSYGVYYDVAEKNDAAAKFPVTPPFDAEARFDSKSEQYYLIRAAKVAELRTAEYVFFKRCSFLSLQQLQMLDETAWNATLSRVKPDATHKNTDAVLFVFADRTDAAVADYIKKAKHSKNYKAALFGYSNYRLVVIEFSSGTVYFNQQAKILTELVGNIIKSFNEEKEMKK